MSPHGQRSHGKQTQLHRARPPDATTTASPPLAVIRGWFAPFFAHTPAGVWWGGFVPCLLAAFALRVGVGLAGDWMVRPDEIFKYLEPAHLLVFGYGQVVWEFSMGYVPWLLPSVPALPMLLCKILGFGHPDFYIPAVKIWNALLSLSIPAGMYLFGRRVMSEPAARLALLFGCFWHEFVIMGSHAFAEQYASVVFFAALVLLSPAASVPRLWVAGFLLGLTFVLRFQYGPLVGVVGLTLLAAYPPARWGVIVLGGLAALVLGGAVDYLTWGRWWSPTRLIVSMIVNGVFAHVFKPENHPFHTHLVSLAGSSYGLYALAAVAVFRVRRHWLLLSMAMVVLLFHMAAPIAEYSNVFVLLPLLWMLIAAASGVFRRSRLRVGAMVATGVLAAVASGAAFGDGVPGWPWEGVPNQARSYNDHVHRLMPDEGGLFHSEEALVVSRDLGRIPAEEMRAVLWGPIGRYADGGYSYAHHRVPMLFPSRNPDHATLSHTRPANTLASHVVVRKGEALPGFSLTREYGRVALLVNDTPEAVQVPDTFSTDFGTRFDRLVLRASRELKVEFPEPVRAFLFPE